MKYTPMHVDESYIRKQVEFIEIKAQNEHAKRDAMWRIGSHLNLIESVDGDKLTTKEMIEISVWLDRSGFFTWEI